MPRGEQRSQQLCWTCQNAVSSETTGRGCEWSRDLRPVPGWTAEMTHKAVMGLTWSITECPKYIPDQPRKEMAF